jgi:zinc transport system ATP-binding protein
VFLARALANEPDLLLLDEPTTGVDVAATESLYELLLSLHKDGITILIVSHDVGVVASYVNGVVCVNRRLIAHGRPEEVLGSEELEQMYGCEAMFFHHGRVPHLVVEKER